MREIVKKQQSGSEGVYIYFCISILSSSLLPMDYQSGLSSVRNINWFISHDESLGPAVNIHDMSTWQS